MRTSTSAPQRHLTLPQQVMAARGLSTIEVARTMNRGKRLTRRELENRAATVARVLRQGDCGALYAQRLGSLLGIDAHLLELPWQCWPLSWRGQQDAKSSAQKAVKTVEGSKDLAFPAGSAGTAAANGRARTRPDKMQILRLVPANSPGPVSTDEDHD